MKKILEDFIKEQGFDFINDDEKAILAKHNVDGIIEESITFIRRAKARDQRVITHFEVVNGYNIIRYVEDREKGKYRHLERTRQIFDYYKKENDRKLK
jgi:hypothetical protein